MGKLLTHQIRVETEEENVTVMIGGDSEIPGGFAKFFNRVVDSGAWGPHLSDAARAAYLPLVRFADQRNQFRVAVGQAALMKYSGLSRSSIKRTVKDLLASKLLVLVEEQGGVTPDGQNESNVYQLMVPADLKARLGGPAAAPGQDAPRPSSNNSHPRSTLNPPGVRQGTPSPAHIRTPRRPGRRAEPVRRPTHRGALPDRSRGAAAAPYSGNSKDIQDSSRLAADKPASAAPQAPLDAAALFGGEGSRTEGRSPARRHPTRTAPDRGRRRHNGIPPRRGGPETTPAASSATPWSASGKPRRTVVEARRQAEARLRQQERERESRWPAHRPKASA